MEIFLIDRAIMTGKTAPSQMANIHCTDSKCAHEKHLYIVDDNSGSFLSATMHIAK